MHVVFGPSMLISCDERYGFCLVPLEVSRFRLSFQCSKRPLCPFSHCETRVRENGLLGENLTSLLKGMIS